MADLLLLLLHLKLVYFSDERLHRIVDLEGAHALSLGQDRVDVGLSDDVHSAHLQLVALLFTKLGNFRPMRILKLLYLLIQREL